MSRIGKTPINLPKGVRVERQGTQVLVSGPKGALSQSFDADMEIELNDGVLTVQRPSDSRQHRSIHGLTRALLNNMVVGVSEGFSKTLQIEGVGYRAQLEQQRLVLNVGYSHPVYFDPPPGIDFAVENRNKTVIVSGIDKQLVGEIASQIRKTRPPEPYKGKGIRYDAEIIRRKAGKAGKI
jgi:large subunit ribosomal protein L6